MLQFQTFFCRWKYRKNAHKSQFRFHKTVYLRDLDVQLSLVHTSLMKKCLPLIEIPSQNWSSLYLKKKIHENKKKCKKPTKWNGIIHFPRNVKSCKKNPTLNISTYQSMRLFSIFLYSVYNAIMVLPRWNLVHLLILQSIHLSCCKIGRQFLTPCFCNQNTTTKAGHVFLLLVKNTVIYYNKSNQEKM